MSNTITVEGGTLQKQTISRAGPKVRPCRRTTVHDMPFHLQASAALCFSRKLIAACPPGGSHHDLTGVAKGIYTDYGVCRSVTVGRSSAQSAMPDRERSHHCRTQRGRQRLLDCTFLCHIQNIGRNVYEVRRQLQLSATLPSAGRVESMPSFSNYYYHIGQMKQRLFLPINWGKFPSA